MLCWSRTYLDLLYIPDNRTYHFQAEDENEQRAWTSVLVNCKEGALMRAFHQQAGDSTNNDSGHSLLDLQRSIIRAVRAMPGNQVCADCGSTNGELYCVLCYLWHYLAFLCPFVRISIMMANLNRDQPSARDIINVYCHTQVHPLFPHSYSDMGRISNIWEWSGAGLTCLTCYPRNVVVYTAINIFLFRTFLFRKHLWYIQFSFFVFEWDYYRYIICVIFRTRTVRH